MSDPQTTMPSGRAHDRIFAILASRNITVADVVERQERHAVGGPKPKANLRSWTFGPGTVAAMLELMVERSVQDASP